MSDRVEAATIENIELLNPTRPEEAEALRATLAGATEIATCLPSVTFYDSDSGNSIAALIAEGLCHRKADATIVYAAENNNHAAEILEEAVAQRLERGTGILPVCSESMGKMPMPRVQFLNTVIGKMSQVVIDSREIERRGLTPIAPGIDRAFLVEEFNRILVSKTTVSGFTPGIEVFMEKDDLLPFEEAKLYGHNAIHALLGFIGTLKGYTKMTEIRGDEPLTRAARQAFMDESGGALVQKYASLGDELFTEAGYRHFAEDLLERMTNPHLADTVARASRDVVRKLGVSDRIFGTMALATEYGIEPRNMAMGALAGIALLLAGAGEYGLPEELRLSDWRDIEWDHLARLLAWLWQEPIRPPFRSLVDCVYAAKSPLIHLIDG